MQSRTEYYREYRKKNRERVRAYNRKYNKKWRAENGYHNERKAAKKFRIKSSTRERTRYAINRGKIKRLPCEVCGKPKGQAHHPDYSKPLKVVFLCSLHHRMIHPHKGDLYTGISLARLKRKVVK